MIRRGFVYKIMVDKYMTYYVVLFTKKSCPENKKAKSTDMKELSVNGVEKRL